MRSLDSIEEEKEEVRIEEAKQGRRKESEMKTQVVSRYWDSGWINENREKKKGDF